MSVGNNVGLDCGVYSGWFDDCRLLVALGWVECHEG